MILVTGANGFVGSYLVCSLLKQGRRVRALKRRTGSLQQFDFIARVNELSHEHLALLEWHDADITNTGDLEGAFEGVTEVIHSAALMSFFQRDKYEMYHTNAEGTANVVNMALASGVQKFAYLSSVAAIGRSVTATTIDESSKWERSPNNSNYAESKFAAEMEVWRGIQEGLNAVIVNPGIIIGPCDFTSGTGKMFDSAYKGMMFHTPGISGFVDVRDVVNSILQLMERNIVNERFILVSENYPFRKFYDEATRCFGKPAPRFNTPLWLAVIGYRLLALQSLFTGKRPLLSKETTHAAYRIFYYDPAKIKKALGYEFIPLKDSIRWTCSWYTKANAPA